MTVERGCLSPSKKVLHVDRVTSSLSRLSGGRIGNDCTTSQWAENCRAEECMHGDECRNNRVSNSTWGENSSEIVPSEFDLPRRGLAAARSIHARQFDEFAVQPVYVPPPQQDPSSSDLTSVAAGSAAHWGPGAAFDAGSWRLFRPPRVEVEVDRMADHPAPELFRQVVTTSLLLPEGNDSAEASLPLATSGAGVKQTVCGEVETTARVANPTGFSDGSKPTRPWSGGGKTAGSTSVTPGSTTPRSTAASSDTGWTHRRGEQSAIPKEPGNGDGCAADRAAPLLDSRRWCDAMPLGGALQPERNRQLETTTSTSSASRASDWAAVEDAERGLSGSPRNKSMPQYRPGVDLSLDAASAKTFIPPHAFPAAVEHRPGTTGDGVSEGSAVNWQNLPTYPMLAARARNHMVAGESGSRHPLEDLASRGTVAASAPTTISPAEAATERRERPAAVYGIPDNEDSSSLIIRAFIGSPDHNNSGIIGVVVFAKVAVVLLVAISALALYYNRTIVITALNSLLYRVQKLGYLGPWVLCVTYTVLISFFAPAEILMLAAGFFFTRPSSFGFYGGFVVASLTCFVAMTLSCCVSFWIARRFLMNPTHMAFGHMAHFRAFTRAVKIGGVKFVGLLRLSPLIPFAISNILLGVTDIDFRNVIVAMPFSLPLVLVTVYLGSAIVDIGHIVQGSIWEWDWDQVALFIVGVVVAVTAMLYIVRLTKQQLEVAAKEEIGDRLCLLESRAGSRSAQTAAAQNEVTAHLSREERRALQSTAAKLFS